MHTKDSDICRYADAYGYVVVTKDADFKNSHFIAKTPKQLIRANLGNINNSHLIDIFQKNLEKFQDHFERGYSYIEIHKEYIELFKKQIVS